MLDHVNSYLFQPLSELLVEVTHFPMKYPSISANHISYLGLVFALIAARLVLSESLHIRRLAVIFFFVRQFLDDLDGLVARYHLGIDVKKQVDKQNHLITGYSSAIFVFTFSIGHHTSHYWLPRGWHL